MSEQITIIGLDRVGISLGLALKSKNTLAECIGFDLDANHARMALEAKAVNRIDGNLHSAVEKADIILLNSLPVDVTGWMEDICRSLKDSAVLVSLAPVHSQASVWAAANFPANRSFVNASLSINGKFLDNEESSVDLFNDGIMIISTLPGTGEEAVQKVLDLAAQVGAIPMFSDPMEADGLLSQTDLFPRVINMLLVQGIKNQSGWSDAQKLTGPIFWKMSKLFFEFPSGESASHEIMTHKDNMLRLLDVMRGQIDSLQDSIETGDEEVLKKSIQKSLDEHNIWMTRRKTGKWDAKEAESEAKPKGMWNKLFGIQAPKKKK